MPRFTSFTLFFALVVLALSQVNVVSANGDMNQNQTAVCVDNTHRCTDVSTDICDRGQWIPTMCGNGTKCLACGDYECVQDWRYESLAEQYCVGPKSSSEVNAKVFSLFGFGVLMMFVVFMW